MFTSGVNDLFQLNHNGFDFNVQFEQLFFSIIPSSLFIVSSLWRTLSLVRKPTVVHAPGFQIAKVAAIATYVGLELSLLVLVALGSFRVTSMFIASSALKLVAALFMTTLSVVDHSRSPRPSVLLSIYLFLTLLLDAAQARTLFLSSDDRPELTYSALFCAAIALKAAILLLEAQHKARWVSWDEKQHSPEETSGIFSLGVFFWLNRLFLAGYHKVLALEDLYPLDRSFDAEALHDKFSRNIDYAKLKGDKYGLAKVLARTLKVPLLLPVPPRLALLGFKLCQPLFLEKLLDYLSQSRLDANLGYGFVGASVLIYAGIAISNALSWYFHHRMRTMARSILVTETFIKATQARIGTGDDGAALTLMSTDMERIKMGFRYLHDLWASLIQAALAAWLLYNRIGAAFAAPIGTVLVCFAGVAVLVHFTGDAQRAWMAHNQKRVGLTATVISGMKNLKISGLSSVIGDYVQKLRVDELAAATHLNMITIIAAVFAYMATLFSPPLTFAFTQHTLLDASTMFTSLSFLTLLTGPLSRVLEAVPELVSGLACLGRIQAFLECETRHDLREVLADMKQHDEKSRDPNAAPSESNSNSTQSVVVIHDGKFGWSADQFVLQGINTRVPQSSLTIVAGPVGSGKSTLCKALLGEVPFSEGRVLLSARFPRIGFCEQTAFLSNGSIRDNIIGFAPFDKERYEEVIEATALRYDLATLPQGDQTNIGSDGISLSGGQKQRVSLARALYLQSDLLVLDDIFSGLDADTEEHVFRSVFGLSGLLRRRGSTVVLCTHSVKHLPAADHIIALGEGTVVEQGTFDELMARQGYVQRLGLKGASDSEASSTAGDSAPKEEALSSASQVPNATAVNIPMSSPVVDGSRQVGDKNVYKYYVKSMGWLLAAWSMFFAALWGFFSNFPTVWLTYWTDNVYSTHTAHSYAYYAGIYALFQGCALISLLLLGIALWIVSIKKAGASLHQNALHTLISAPLRFFSTTDTGVVTNLFSQDLNLIDTELPNATLNILYCAFQSIGQAGVMLTSSLYLAISYPFLGVLLYFVQKFYLRTSRQLRLLDLEAKSPLYTHFLDTVKGIATLRALGSVGEEIRKNVRLINTSQRPAYLLMMIQEWLNLVLELVVMVMAVLLTALAVQLHSSSAFAGASLVSLISFGDNLSGIVSFYTRLETSIGAVARLKAFTDTVKPEDREDEVVVPPEDWPRRGVVELRGVSATYDTNHPTSDTTTTTTNPSPPAAPGSYALRNINLTIPAGSRTAICGRTGSGKSTLLALLLKLLDPLPSPPSSPSPLLTIDSTPLQTISRSALRQRLIAIPQDAVFLPDGSSSTFAANLDPPGAATRAEREAVLAAVPALGELVAARGGLDGAMSAGRLSAGEKQLVALGRAVLRRRVRGRVGTGEGVGGVLLLDEVSSSVDRETERVMREVIAAEFEGYTVIAVSHRLEMVMDYDTVVVMDRGEVVEVGQPRVLAGQAGSRFGELVKAGST